MSRSRRAFAAASSGFLVVLVLYLGLSYAVYLLARSSILSRRYSSESSRTFFDATGALPFGLFEGGARPVTATEVLLFAIVFFILYCLAGALVAVAVRSRFLPGAALSLVGLSLLVPATLVPTYAGALLICSALVVVVGSVFLGHLEDKSRGLRAVLISAGITLLVVVVASVALSSTIATVPHRLLGSVCWVLLPPVAVHFGSPPERAHPTRQRPAREETSG